MKRLYFSAAAFLIIFLPVNAFAYLDPGTGSYVLQVVIAFAVSAAFVIKTFWHTLKEKISKLFTKDK